MRIGFGPALLITALMALSGTAVAKEPEHGASEWSSEKFLNEAVSWGDLNFAVGADSITLTWTGLEIGPNASAEIRRLANMNSESDDNEVDQDEYENFVFVLKTTFEEEFSKWVNQHQYSGTVLIDNAEPSEVAVTITQADGLKGAVDSGENIRAALEAVVAFPNVDDYKDVHTIRLDLGEYYIVEGNEEDAARFAKDLSLTIQGAEGWSLDEKSIQPDCASAQYDDGAMTFSGEDARCFTGHSGVLLAFAVTGEGKQRSFLPGFELVGMLIAGVGSALALRRRF